MTTIFYPRTNILFEEVDSYDITNSDQYHKYNLLDFVYDAPDDSNPPLGQYWTGVSGSSFTQNDLQERGYTSDYSSALDSLNSIQLVYMGWWSSEPYGYATSLFNGSVDKYIANDGITEGTEYLTFAIYIDSQKLLQYGDSYTMQIKDDNSGDDTIIAYPNGSFWDANGKSHGLDFSVTFRGGTGEDTITGYIQDDYLYGDEGNDKITGGLGNDEIYGGEGTDTAVFSNVDNTVNLEITSIQDTGEGWDYLDSIENVRGGAGNDVIRGNSEANTIKGNSGGDKLYGDSGNDKLYGGSGKDKLKGEGGDDYLKAHSGNDKLYGGSGDDILWGGSGKDKLKGGSGNDIFKLTKGSGYDRIRDFKKGEDKINFQGFDDIGIVGKGNHSKIYNGDDLLAIVYNETDISSSGDYLI